MNEIILACTVPLGTSPSSFKERWSSRARGAGWATRNSNSDTLDTDTADDYLFKKRGIKKDHTVIPMPLYVCMYYVI